jgi:hypothetical protein
MLYSIGLLELDILLNNKNIFLSLSPGGIIKYMKAQVGPSSKELSSVETLEAFIGKDDVAVVGFFQKESDLKAAFLGVADKLRETVRFGHSSNSAVLEKQGVK